MVGAIVITIKQIGLSLPNIHGFANLAMQNGLDLSKLKESIKGKLSLKIIITTILGLVIAWYTRKFLISYYQINIDILSCYIGVVGVGIFMRKLFESLLDSYTLNFNFGAIGNYIRSVFSEVRSIISSLRFYNDKQTLGISESKHVKVKESRPIKPSTSLMMEQSSGNTDRPLMPKPSSFGHTGAHSEITDNEGREMLKQKALQEQQARQHWASQEEQARQYRD